LRPSLSFIFFRAWMALTLWCISSRMGDSFRRAGLGYFIVTVDC
jgi:hypothetical protein